MALFDLRPMASTTRWMSRGVVFDVGAGIRSIPSNGAAALAAFSESSK